MRSEKKAFISVGHRPNLIQYHESVLELLGEGRWRVVSAAEYMAAHMQAVSDRPAE
jgi:putative ATP-binding cassette transporter